MMTDAVLVLNAGSSSIKFGLFDISESDPRLLCKGLLDEHQAKPGFTVTDAAGNPLFEKRGPSSHHSESAPIAGILNWSSDFLAGGTLAVVGHRVVHGGRDFEGPAEVTDKTIEADDRPDGACAPAPAALLVADARHQIASARSQANCMLRHCFSSRPCATRQPLCDPTAVRRDGNPALWLSRTFL